ncbi:unannotated protein [freshwater metagenome]|uniref:Unannotated protein n=1 Tax=freshwater metagenome TaxID=449393 RepID=A0A6J6AZ17_9ZZZZ
MGVCLDGQSQHIHHRRDLVRAGENCGGIGDIERSVPRANRIVENRQSGRYGEVIIHCGRESVRYLGGGGDEVSGPTSKPANSIPCRGGFRERPFVDVHR